MGHWVICTLDIGTLPLEREVHACVCMPNMSEGAHHKLPVDLLLHVGLLLELEYVLDEEVVQRLVGKVDAQLRERVETKVLEAEDVEDARRVRGVVRRDVPARLGRWRDDDDDDDDDDRRQATAQTWRGRTR